MDLVQASLAKSSHDTYERAAKSFNTFRCLFGFPLSWPVEPVVLGLYVSHLHANHYAPSTMATYVSAIGYYHKLRSLADPSVHFLVQRALQGARKLHPQADVRLPITQPLLIKLVNAAQQCLPSPYRKCMVSSMLLLAFAAFLRVGEMTISQGNEDNVLRLADITFLPNGYLSVLFRHFKHADGQRRIEVGNQQAFCPVTHLAQFIGLRGTKAGYLYCWPSGKAVSRAEFCRMLKCCLNFCDLDTSLYKSHSFRIGAACHAASLGHSDAQIREMGRWKSDAFKKYIRL